MGKRPILNDAEVAKFMYEAATKGKGATAIKGPGDGHFYSDGTPVKEINIGWRCNETGETIMIQYGETPNGQG